MYLERHIKYYDNFMPSTKPWVLKNQVVEYRIYYSVLGVQIGRELR